MSRITVVGVVVVVVVVVVIVVVDDDDDDDVVVITRKHDYTELKRATPLSSMVQVQ